MRSKYFIWWLIPFVIFGSIIIDLQSYRNVMLLASLYFIPFSLILGLLGGIYFLLREKKERSRIAGILIDTCTVYTAIVSIISVLIPLLSSFGFYLVFINEIFGTVFSPFGGLGLYLFGLVQLVALTLLLLDH